MKSEESTTLDYYNKNAYKYVDGTINVDFENVQNKFISYLSKGGRVLDFGCGSGRDTKYFISKGYDVDATDGSEELCKIASENIGIKVRHMLFSELDEYERYDAIWACSSVLHLSKPELKNVFRKMIQATKEGGYIYMSFKYGSFEGYRDGRYFTDFTEETFDEFIGDFTDVVITEEWVSSDVRPDRGNEKWLNLILQKLNTL